MKKTLIFPLNEDTINLIQNIEMCKEYQIVAVSSYKEDKKRLEIMNKNLNLYCSVDFKSCLEMVDVVIFAENTMGRTYSGYKLYVEEAIKNGNTIIISSSLIELLGLDDKKGNINILQKRNLIEKEGISHLKEISIPVLTVMGLGKNCDKFNLQIKIKKIIEKKGYNTLSICSNSLGKFLGMEILPGFLFSRTLSLPIKIEAFNLWIYNLQRQSNADIILLGCPGGIMRFEDYEYNYFSEIPLVIYNAVDVDNSILTLYRNCFQNEETITKLKTYCEMKYDTIAEDFVISSQHYTLDQEIKKLSYYSKNAEIFEMPVIENEKCFLSGIEEDEKLEIQINRILNELQNNFFAI